MQGQHPDALPLDLDLPPVDQPLLPLDLVGQLDPAVAQGMDARVQRVLDDRRQFQDLGPEALHVAEEAAADRDPPVVPSKSPACGSCPIVSIPVPFRPFRTAGLASPGHRPFARSSCPIRPVPIDGAAGGPVLGRPVIVLHTNSVQESRIQLMRSAPGNNAKPANTREFHNEW